MCENQSGELTVRYCISGVHDLQKAQIHAVGWFLKNLRQKRHGGGFPVQVGLTTTPLKQILKVYFLIVIPKHYQANG